MSNFAFLPKLFDTIQSGARKAEAQILGDPRASCFYARFALEAFVHWLYRHEQSLQMPYERHLGALLHEPTFQNFLPSNLAHKVRLIQKIGNQAVHHPRPIRQYDALQSVKELHHLCYWLTRTYAPEVSRDGAGWKEERVPKPFSTADVVPRKELEALEQKLAEQSELALKRQQEKDSLDAELIRIRKQLVEARQRSEQQQDPHDYSEADTRKYLIDLDLQRVGWDLEQPNVREYEVSGMPNPSGKGFVDYVLWGDDGKPLAVVEAKKSTKDPNNGKQQAKLYADCLEQMHGQRPLIFYTNGYETHFWDDTRYPSRPVAGFYKKEELHRLILRRTQLQPLDGTMIRDEIVERYYQKRAIVNIFDQFNERQRKVLLVMATGTGKTRVAIALVDVLQRAGWVKRALFLADRKSLVNQACNAFKAHLPDSSPVNLVTEKNTEGRVYVSTYQTMMGLINDTKGGELRFGVGHFDLVIIDEAHRSVYQKYGAIFKYFDAQLVGLTATPREEIDKNTYDLFDLESGVPTDAYELELAVKDGFLVPPKVQQVDLRFPREGIDYESLTEEEKAQWESIDWGDDVEPGTMPDRVNATAINSWLFNKDTVDKVLQHLMEHGHKVDGGDRLAKTIVFARNHKHATFIVEQFDKHYPHYAGHFARVIAHEEKYPQSLIDAFSQKEKAPHLAVSVDMLDTGIDVPEVANLVFFKPVYSRIKFWQMIGRGTRLCKRLHAEDQDKQDFRIFDFCFNFDFFRENPDGINASDSAPLGKKLFKVRVQVLRHLRKKPEKDPEQSLGRSLKELLKAEVKSMNPDNFIVRMNLEAVEKFQQEDNWQDLSEEDLETLQGEVAGLPSSIPTDELESRQFDLMLLQMQLDQLQGSAARFENARLKVVDMAGLLEEKSNIPDVAKQLAYLAELQNNSFWEGITLSMLEDLRLRLRGLIPLLDKKKRTIIITNFEDEVVGVRDEEVIYIPKMTGAQYEKKVREYLKNHLDHMVIHRLRSNQSLTELDLQGLEQTLVEIGEEEGSDLLSGLLERSAAPSLIHFVRSMVGMDRSAAQAAFASFLSDRSLNANQIRFIEMVIDQLTARGVMEAAALYEAPFISLHAGGPDELFQGKENVIEGVFEALATLEPKLLKAG